MAEETQHQALYRRYRPQTPAEVLGQDHVVRALTGAIREGRLHHAFLFCGPRGTGKTSTARILAKMVNCEQGPTAEPCGTCSQCVAVRDGSHLDVVEIDAASHGGVEDARELREKAPTAPVQGREKVYIIDEAQRLSREAFDALLKVFEEPPPGVRFVLATTEPHKMPATIVGRCQRFDFRRLTMDDLAAHLVAVAHAEGQTIEPSAAHAIARQAEGSARDALSLLDQAGVLGGATIDDDVVRTLLGAPRGEVQHELADSVAIGDAKGVFEIVGRLVQDGQDLRNVTAESLAHYRNLLLVKTAPGQTDLVDVPDDAYETLRIQAEKFSPAELARVLALLLAAQNDMRWTTSPRLSLELALVRSTMPETDDDPAALLTRLERLERLANLDPGAVVPTTADVAHGPTPKGPADDVEPIAPIEPPVPVVSVEASEPPDDGDRAPAAPEPNEAPSATTAGGTDTPEEPTVQMPVPHAADAGSVDVALLRRSWQSLLEHLSANRQMILAAILESATVASYDGSTLELAFPPDRKVGPQKVEGKKPELQAALGDLFGVRPDIVCVVREVRDAGGPATVEIVDEDEVVDEAEALRRVQEMLGAQVAAETEPAE
ncbi:MAG TPA: DNA polymerase III subunit gamma/tau [Actinomycetota bacterium]|nr:DNA polymerase III subunit gamma/tau [Actinomycetota bacterium]